MFVYLYPTGSGEPVKLRLVDNGDDTYSYAMTDDLVASTLKTEKFEYQNGLLIYHGIAKAGTAPGDAGWAIRKFTYDADGRLVSKAWANPATGTDRLACVYDNRAVLTYN